VLAYRLWPRSLVQPPLIAADRTSLTLQATQNTRRPEQLVRVDFTAAQPTELPADLVAAPPLVTVAGLGAASDLSPAGEHPPNGADPRSDEEGLRSEEMSVHLET
jgi:hypothetical protein